MWGRSPKGVAPNRLTYAYLFADTKCLPEIFADSVIGSDLRVISKRFKLTHIGQPFFSENSFIGLDIQHLSDEKCVQTQLKGVNQFTFQRQWKFFNVGGVDDIAFRRCQSGGCKLIGCSA